MGAVSTPVYRESSHRRSLLDKQFGDALHMTQPLKAMDQKLDRIRAGNYKPADFIVADAKDGEMGDGTNAPGPYYDDMNRPLEKRMPREAYRNAQREMVKSGLVDIMLSALSTQEVLVAEGLYENSPVTPACRLNDATDIWGFRGASYKQNEQARPFRTVRLDRARDIVDLGLYAITFYNDIDRDVDMLNKYSAFRDEAESVGMRHFLEVFNPVKPVDTYGVDFGFYLNDAITRALAGVVKRDRPVFLKMAYNGPRIMEELAAYDPTDLVVGILGGPPGTARDTFEMISQAERHGARISLFGRKIYAAESAIEMVRGMRQVIERETTPAEAVKIYHDKLAKMGIHARRSLADDMQVTEPLLKAGT
jgi:hypothetical protein